MNVLIFKTNLDHPDLIKQAAPIIQNLPNLHRWNIDLHDCDHVLRIEASELLPESVEAVLQHAGYYCKELAD